MRIPFLILSLLISTNLIGQNKSIGLSVGYFGELQHGTTQWIGDIGIESKNNTYGALRIEAYMGLRQHKRLNFALTSAYYNTLRGFNIWNEKDTTGILRPVRKSGIFSVDIFQMGFISGFDVYSANGWKLTALVQPAVMFQFARAKEKTFQFRPEHEHLRPVEDALNAFDDIYDPMVFMIKYGMRVSYQSFFVMIRQSTHYRYTTSYTYQEEEIPLMFGAWQPIIVDIGYNYHF